MISSEVVVKKAFYTLINIAPRMPAITLVTPNGSQLILLWMADRRREMNGSGKIFFFVQSLAECSFEAQDFPDNQ